MNKRFVIGLLVSTNLFLLAALILTSYSPPQAFAQGIARSGEYILLAAESQVNNDTIYLIDLRSQQLHAFQSTYPRMGGQAARVTLIHTRDLVRDFR